MAHQVGGYGRNVDSACYAVDAATYEVMGNQEEYAQGLYEYCCMNGADHQRLNNQEIVQEH